MINWRTIVKKVPKMYHLSHLSKNRRSWSIYGAMLILVALTCASLVAYSYSEDVHEGLAGNLVRLHVVANSDSPEDQALKRQVRDELIQYMEKELSQVKNLRDAKLAITERLGTIESIAGDVVKKSGYDYGAKAEFGTFDFPTKLYGDIALPGGRYEALKVNLGRSEGANWWCVLFPPLCFVDASHGTISDSVKGELKKVLSEEEFKVITTSDPEEELPIRIKFKIVELFQGVKVKELAYQFFKWNVAN